MENSNILALDIEKKLIEQSNEFIKNVNIGSALAKANDITIDKFKNKRFQFNLLLSYLRNTDDRVCILCGLRRTGKSVLIEQSMAHIARELGSVEKIAHMICSKDDDMNKLTATMKHLYSKGIEYFFIDEITRCGDFVHNSSQLADIFARQGCYIVISGTESLFFRLAVEEELLGRAKIINTTNIKYAEHVLLAHDSEKEKKSLKYFLQTGGILGQGGDDGSGSLQSSNDTETYCNSAIIDNIEHALRCCSSNSKEFGYAYDIHKAGLFKESVWRLINKINNNFYLESLVSKFVNDYVGFVKKNALAPISDLKLRNDLLELMKNKDINEKFMAQLGISSNTSFQIIGTNRYKLLYKYGDNNDKTFELQNHHLDSLLYYLMKIGVFAFAKKVTCEENKDAELNKKTYIFNNKNISFFVQAGMRYQFLSSWLKILDDSESFKKIGLDNRLKNDFKTRAQNTVMEKILEDIVLFEVKEYMPTNKKYDVFKYTGPNNSEFDMIIWNPNNNCCFLYEIKLSSKPKADHAKHLLSKKECSIIESEYGKILGKFVLYTGDNTTYNNILYINVAEFLKSLPENYPTVGLDNMNKDMSSFDEEDEDFTEQENHLIEILKEDPAAISTISSSLINERIVQACFDACIENDDLHIEPIKLDKYIPDEFKYILAQKKYQGYWILQKTPFGEKYFWNK